MKRWILGVMLVLFTAGVIMPLAPGVSPAPQAAPERKEAEPRVHLFRRATGERLVLPMEEYVLGVVAAEMDPSFPPQALAAQAILARTYTLNHLRRGVEATDDPGEFQAYDPSRITDEVRQAVVPTRGLVITFNGELVDAVYHACAGGRTAGAEEGMGAPDKAYLRPVADPPCRRDETWEATFTTGELAAAIGALGHARSVKVGRRGPTGRALSFVINGREISAGRLRGALGARMKSTFVTDVRLEGRRVTMRGRGYGHGVGMSQWGAAALADQGLSAEEIIRHYFSDIQIEARW